MRIHFLFTVAMLTVVFAGSAYAQDSYPETMARTQREIDLARKRQELNALMNAGRPADYLPQVVSIFSRKGKFYARIRSTDGIEQTVTTGDSINGNVAVESITDTLVTVKSGKRLATSLTFVPPRNSRYSADASSPHIGGLPGLPAPPSPLR